jgi:hypothetical protein
MLQRNEEHCRRLGAGDYVIAIDSSILVFLECGNSLPLSGDPLGLPHAAER